MDPDTGPAPRRYHLAELRADLGAAVRALDELPDAAGARSLVTLRAHLPGLIALVEHALDVHLAALVEGVAPASRAAPRPRAEWNLMRARAAASLAAAASAAQADPPDLRVAATEAAAARRELAGALEWSAERHHQLDPEVAAREREWAERGTAERVCAHPRARSLDACPRCGAPLTAEDRTFDGSFCEACGTRWSTASPGSPPAER